MVHDKNEVNKIEAKKKLCRNFKRGYYWKKREWQYMGLTPRIIAEPLLEDKGYPYLRDFKFYTFMGEPKIFYITSDKGDSMPVREDFFDMTGTHLDVQDTHYTNNPTHMPDLPINLDKMIEYARILAKNTYHLRVDFYEVNGKVYVGELTLHENAGFVQFTPDHWNKTLGDWIKLPIDK